MSRPRPVVDDPRIAQLQRRVEAQDREIAALRDARDIAIKIAAAGLTRRPPAVDAPLARADTALQSLLIRRAVEGR